jgi:hypothetical protein
VFPAVGKANLVIGGALGRGEVFEKGKKVGYATITQLTIGVQIGGDTFDEVVVFESRESFERFKRGKTAFAANASAVLVKAGAASAKDFEKGAAVYVYPHGGMMLELAIGGQRFKFKPADEEQDEGKQKGGQQSGKASGKGKGAQGRAREDEDEGEEEGQDEGDEAGEGEEGDDEASSSGGGNRALELAGRAVGGVRSAAAKATEMVKRHPVAATVAGVGVVAGLGLLIARAMSGSGAEEGEEDQDSGGEDEEQDEGAQDSAEDSGEDQSDEEEDQDRDEEGEDTDARAEDEGEEEEGEDEGSEEDESENRGVLSRLLSRGKSRA